MSNVAYTDDFRLRVVAVASVKGAPQAAKQFGVPVRAVRAWIAERPADEDQLDLNIALAQQELTIDLAEGKNRHRLPITYGILRDKRQRYGKAARPVVEEKTEAELWADELARAIDKAYGADADLALTAAIRYMETDGEDDTSVRACLDHVASLGDLKEWNALRQAEDSRRVAEQLERNKVGALLWRARSELLRSA